MSAGVSEVVFGLGEWEDGGHCEVEDYGGDEDGGECRGEAVGVRGEGKEVVVVIGVGREKAPSQSLKYTFSIRTQEQTAAFGRHP